MSLVPTLAYWKLDEASGNAADSSGNGFTLTNQNTVPFAAGKINNGADFGASNTNKHFSNTNNMGLAVDAARSYEVWVNITTAPSSGTTMDLMGQGYSANDVFYQIEYLNNGGTKQLRVGRARNGIDDPTLIYNVDLGTGAWHQIIYTNDGAYGQKLYVDGALVGSNTATSGNGSGGGTFNGMVLSRALFSVARVVQGKLDEAAVYAGAITSTDVTQSYNSGAGIQYPYGYPTVNSLTVAGGGGGGAGAAGGGGGGGVYPNATLAIPYGSYSITVGAGGAAQAGTNQLGNNGSNSSIGSLTLAIGGGGGGAYHGQSGLAGGSGGGGGGTDVATPGVGGAGTAGQGNNGGAGYDAGGSAPNTYPSGGGGGAGAVGNPGTSSGNGGNGGAGVSNSISGSAVTYGGGGGGSISATGGTAGTGGSGGGGNGGKGNTGMTAGTANTGGGGGGGQNGFGQAGGSGVVIIAYTTGLYSCTGGTITTSGGNTIHTFTTSGTFTIAAPVSSIPDARLFFI